MLSGVRAQEAALKDTPSLGNNVGISIPCAGSKNCVGPSLAERGTGPPQFFDPGQDILIPTLFPRVGTFQTGLAPFLRPG